jgi:hypothetical protein
MIKLKLFEAQKKPSTQNQFILPIELFIKKNHIVWVEEFYDYLKRKIAFIEGIFIDITERKTSRKYC